MTISRDTLGLWLLFAAIVLAHGMEKSACYLDGRYWQPGGWTGTGYCVPFQPRDQVTK